MYSFSYVIEQRLPNGAWQKVSGSITARSESEVRNILERQNANPIRIISITRR